MLARWSARLRRLRKFFQREEWSAYWLQLPRTAEDSDEAGLVLVQIDGLSAAELQRGISAGSLPFLFRLLDKEHFRLHSLYSGLPSSTPSVQGELFYRQKCAVPAFGFRDHRTNRLVRMFQREVALEVEQRLAVEREGLLAGGSSYCNIYEGGAAESHFCAASLGWDNLIRRARRWRLTLVTCFYLWTAVRICGLLIIEFGLALWDFLRGWQFLKSHALREFWQELLMVPARVIVVILLRELAIHGAIMDMARGLPIIHLNLLGYDEQAHRRGPDSRFAHWTLKGIDAAIARLWRFAHRATSRH